MIRKVNYDGGSSSKRMKEGCGFFCDLLDSLSEAVIVAGEIWLFSVESHLRYCLDHVVGEAADFIDVYLPRFAVACCDRLLILKDDVGDLVANRPIDIIEFALVWSNRLLIRPQVGRTWLPCLQKILIEPIWIRLIAIEF